jgi:DNA-binding transcriptional MerR regulator/methylmalonyl-CoA mutase cobalamin-binding subunit
MIRTWEKRYGVVQPKRSETNRRMYTDADVERLRLLSRVVNLGHNISTVATLNDRELTELVAVASGANEASHAQAFEGGGASELMDANDSRHLVDSAISRIIQLDDDGLEDLLSQAAVMLPRHQFLQDLIIPILYKIGGLWARGNLKIVHEHMLSAIVRSILWDMLKSVKVPEMAPKIVVATPVGHWHECGALVTSVAAAESGWRVVYFGPCLPAEEMAYAVKKVNARALAISIGHAINDLRMSVELKKIRRYLSRKIPIFFGGSGASAAAEALKDINAIQADDLSQFRLRIGSLCRNGQSETLEEGQGHLNGVDPGQLAEQ